MPSIKRTVRSDNIGIISLRANFNEQARNKEIPSAIEMFETILYDFDTAIDKARNNPDRIKELTDNKAEFIRLIEQTPPNGFEFVPVMLNQKSDEKTRGNIKDEYKFHIKRSFIRFVANNFEDELLSHGISKYALASMKEGSASQENFPFEVDHIIERAHSGIYGDQKENDPLNKDRADSFIANHFRNLILIPTPIHELKNKVRYLQSNLYGYGQNKFCLMLTPIRQKNKSGYVAEPQEKGSPYAVKISDNFRTIVNNINYLNNLNTAESIIKGSIRIQKIKNINEELTKKLNRARNSTGKKTSAKNYSLELFCNYKPFKELEGKLKLLDHKEAEKLTNIIEKAREYLNRENLPKPKKPIKNNTNTPK